MKKIIPITLSLFLVLTIVHFDAFAEETYEGTGNTTNKGISQSVEPSSLSEQIETEGGIAVEEIIEEHSEESIENGNHSDGNSNDDLSQSISPEDEQNIESSDVKESDKDNNQNLSEEKGEEDEIIDSGTCGDSNSITWVLYDSGLLEINGSGLMFGGDWNRYASSIKEVMISDGVTSIGSCAFYGCSGLTNISIPESVTSIESGAFSGCRSLTNISIPESVTRIESDTFYYCSGLTNISIPESVTSIGSSAFYGCSGLTNISIPNSVTSIDSYAFYGCRSLASIQIPDSVTSIDSYAFRGCSSLTSISIPESVTSIGSYAFYGCSGLTSISIPESVTSIGSYAFYGCSGLTNISIPERVTNIGNYAFYGCSGLTNISISEGVTSIGSRAFSGCSGLTSISIPSSVTSIGNASLSGCSNLVSIEIPLNRLSGNGDWLFGYYFGTESFDGGVATRQFWGQINSVTYCIPETLENVVLTSGNETTISYGTFYGCSNIKSITLPDGITTIDQNAFCGCSSLRSITIPASVGGIDKSAFSACSSLSEVHINDIASWCKIYYSNATSNPLSNSANLYLCGNCITSLVIPEGVTKINDYAFYGWKGLESISIPNSVTSIGMYAFYCCSNLTSVSIPGNVASIGYSAFYGCSSLTNISIPDSVTSISERAFSYCSSITSISIPDSVTSIGNYAFSGCSSLTNISIPDSVTSIENYAFSGCNKLTSISIPDSVTSIAGGALYNCSSLKSVSLPNNLTSIEERVFYNCSALTSIIIPESVTIIGERAFYKCSSLKSITISESVTRFGANAFYGTSNVTCYTVPNSFASQNFSKVVYLCDTVEPANDYLGFITDSMVLKVEETYSLSDYIITNFDLAECTIQVSDEDVCEYDDGEITTWEEGTCTITVKKGNYRASVTIVVQNGDASAIESLTFASSNLKMNKGETVANTVSMTPHDADASAIIWSSSDESVATIKNGKITAIGPGSATITAYSNADYTVTAKCDVTVKSPLYDIIPLETDLSLEKGDSRNLSYYKYPLDTTDEISFISSNTDVVTIDNNGKLTAEGAGTAEVTIASNGISKIVTVNVSTGLEGISFEMDNIQLMINQTLQMNVIYDPVDASSTGITWSSSKESVATVDENGLVTVVGKGIANITATSDEGYTATCKIVCRGEVWSDIGAITSANVVLQNDITAKLYAAFTEEPSSISMNITMNGNKTEIQGVKQTNGKYVFRYDDISPEYIGDTFSAVMTYTVNGQTYTDKLEDYSIKKYCMRVINTSDSELAQLIPGTATAEETRRLMVDTLYYGAEAQQYLGYKTDELATNELTEEQKALATTYVSPTESEGVITTMLSGDKNDDYYWYSTKVNLDNAAKMRFYFMAPNGTTGLTVKVAGVTKEIQETSTSGKYYVEITDIAADTFGNAMTATFELNGAATGQTLTYSLNTYVKQTESHATFGNIARRLYNYGRSSLAYTNN